MMTMYLTSAKVFVVMMWMKVIIYWLSLLLRGRALFLILIDLIHRNLLLRKFLRWIKSLNFDFFLLILGLKTLKMRWLVLKGFYHAGLIHRCQRLVGAHLWWVYTLLYLFNLLLNSYTLFRLMELLELLLTCLLILRELLTLILEKWWLILGFSRSGMLALQVLFFS